MYQKPGVCLHVFKMADVQIFNKVLIYFTLKSLTARHIKSIKNKVLVFFCKLIKGQMYMYTKFGFDI